MIFHFMYFQTGKNSSAVRENSVSRDDGGGPVEAHLKPLDTENLIFFPVTDEGGVSGASLSDSYASDFYCFPSLERQ